MGEPLAAAEKSRWQRLKRDYGACRKFFRVYEMVGRRADFAPEWRSVAVILSAIVEKLKRQSKGDFKGRHFEA